MNIIDPHIHLFDLVQGEYQWLQKNQAPFWPDKPLIARTIHQTELQLESPLNLAGFVHIEAGFDNEKPWREIAWLEQHCTMPFKAIAGINLKLPTYDFQLHIKQLLSFKSVVGVRDIIDEKGVDYFSDPQVKTNLTFLAEQSLLFELQMPLTDSLAVSKLCGLLKSLVNLTLVINHAGSPLINISEQKWLSGLKKLALFEQCFIKCSGFEMSSRDYSEQWKDNIITTCIASFGYDRTMLASNFPLCWFKQSYSKTWRSLSQPLNYSTQQLEKLCYLNAQRIYQF